MRIPRIAAHTSHRCRARRLHGYVVLRILQYAGHCDLAVVCAVCIVNENSDEMGAS
jgi:hypothetical protein